MISRLYQIDDEQMYHDTADAIGLAYMAHKGSVVVGKKN
jgi:hypothetical protein